MLLLRRRTNVNRIIRPSLLPSFPPIPFHKPHLTGSEHAPAGIRFLHVGRSEVNETLNVVNADYAAIGAEEVREHMREVAASGADVEDAGGGMEVREEGFGSGGVHVRGGNCGAESDGLGGVFVGERRGVMRSVNLFGVRVMVMVSTG